MIAGILPELKYDSNVCFLLSTRACREHGLALASIPTTAPGLGYALLREVILNLKQDIETTLACYPIPP